MERYFNIFFILLNGILVVGDMMKKRISLIILVIVIILVLFWLFFALIKKSNDIPIDKNNYSQIYLYDLGESDIEIIIKNDFVVVVNTGLEKDRDNLLDYFDKLGITEIDYLILTNRDEKYIGNASFIVENFKVDYLYLNDYEYSSDIVDDLLDTLNDSYTEKIILTFNEGIKISDLNINIYPYLEDEFVMEDKTFVINILEGNNSIYLTSDASSKRLREISSTNLIVSENSDIFDFDSEYYIYDGTEKIKNKSNLLKRNVEIYMNDKEFIIE